MSYRRQFSFTVMMLLVFSALAMGLMAQDDAALVRTGERSDAPSYGIRGSYMVGTRDFVIEGDAPLNITVWYPALNSENVDEQITYAYESSWEVPPGIDKTVSGHAISEAAYDLSADPYPLVILSHGFALGRTTYAWLGEHLASYGFVVIAPQHHDTFEQQMPGLWQGAITRPQEILSVLAYADEQVGAGGTLEGLINTELVAVIGHSYGGYTALAAAGAQLDMGGFEEFCEVARAANDPFIWSCDSIVPFAADMAALAGLDSVPEALWPSWADGRVDAIVPMAGDAYLFDQAGLAQITVPVMAIGGSSDTLTPYLWGTQPTYEHVSSTTKARVTFENAEHMIFGSSCDAIPMFVEIGFYQLCSDPVWDIARAHDLISHFTTAFLLATLNDDATAAAVLSPDAITFPGVTYEVEGF